MYKMNRFHWHLTEDQGWRIEIKKYPKLQEISAYRNETLVGHFRELPHKFDGQVYGGYYTQEEVREIVKYASERSITVIPEIEMPGHSQAVLAAYPEFACKPGPYEVGKTWGVMKEVFCPYDRTFEFLQDVLLEVMDLFPSEYIHIGGDECPKDRWEESEFCQDLIKKHGLEDEHGLQSYFIKRIEKFLLSHDRKLIGWDEILEGGLAPEATVMSWRGVAGGIQAAQEGHDVIMTPTGYCYLDYYQSKLSNEPLAIGGFLPIEKVYSYDPIPEELSEGESKHILGVQGNIWTEYMKSSKHVEYMAFPRAIAIAEVGWSKLENKNITDFKSRLGKEMKRLSVYGVNYAKHIFDEEMESEITSDGYYVNMKSENESLPIFYTTDGSQPTISSKKYSSPVHLTSSKVIKSASFENGKLVSNVNEMDFNFHLGVGRDISLVDPPHKNYSSGGKEALINGIQADSKVFGDGEWLAWSGKNLKGTIDLGEEQQISEVSTRFFNARGSWIYPPKSVSISVSLDGDTFESLEPIIKFKEETVISIKQKISKKARYLKIEVENFGIIPVGTPGEGSPSWLFVDEIMIE
jgi:hexosaminidase